MAQVRASDGGRYPSFGRATLTYGESTAANLRAHKVVSSHIHMHG